MQQQLLQLQAPTLRSTASCWHLASAMLRTCAVRTHLLWVVLAVAAAAAWCSGAEALPRHSCVHDELDRPAHRSPQLYVNHAHDARVGETERRRRLDATPWQPIRIKVRGHRSKQPGSLRLTLSYSLCLMV